ncbi:MAG: hypothetical protein ACRCW2_13080 [Cellulosilyticaceae bacterium]
MKANMKKYLMGIASFLIIWNIFYSIFLRVDIPSLAGVPVLLIAFAVTLVLAQKCTVYFLQEHNKKLAMGYMVVIVGVGLGMIVNLVSSYMPKGFEDLLGCKPEKITQIMYTYGQEGYGVIEGREQIDELLTYLESFTYRRKKEQETSQTNLEENSYRLGLIHFVKSDGRMIYASFLGPELLVGTTFYEVEEGAIQEAVVLELLGYEGGR